MHAGQEKYLSMSIMGDNKLYLTGNCEHYLRTHVIVLKIVGIKKH